LGRGQASGAAIPHGTLELVAEDSSISAGHQLNLGLRFELEKGWHVYWINPGDSGEPPRVEWHLPAGFTAGAIEWPTPQRLGAGSIVDYGYEGTLLLIVPVRVAAHLAAQSNLASQPTAQLGAEAKLLVCSHEMCVPGKAQNSLTLPIKTLAPVVDARTSAWFSDARKSLPRPVPAQWKLSLADAKDSFVLTVNLGHRVTEAVFFPLAASQIQNAAAQTLQPTTTGCKLTLRKSDQLLKPIARLQGVLALSGSESYRIDVAVGHAGTISTHSSSTLKFHTFEGGILEMKRPTIYSIAYSAICSTLVALVLCAAPAAAWAAKVGDAAPDFTGTASSGKTVHLADYRGKYVVLEWHNNGCPYVRKQYNSGNMQRLQKQWTGKGVVWFTILSSAPGKQGFVSASEENDYLAKMQAAPTAALLDPTGSLGHLYDAKTSPHMFVISPQGVLIYDGAIDDKPTTDLADVPGAANYVSLALEEAMAGKPVAMAATRPYGCSVKYSDEGR
jgi:DsbC/DsbD-like thiol-disulfide interchange protein/peroxiredoxin